MSTLHTGGQGNRGPMIVCRAAEVVQAGRQRARRSVDGRRAYSSGDARHGTAPAPLPKRGRHERPGSTLPHEAQDGAVEGEVILAARAGRDVPLDLGTLFGAELVIEVWEDVGVDLAAARIEATDRIQRRTVASVTPSRGAAVATQAQGRGPRVTGGEEAPLVGCRPFVVASLMPTSSLPVARMPTSRACSQSDRWSCCRPRYSREVTVPMDLQDRRHLLVRESLDVREHDHHGTPPAGGRSRAGSPLRRYDPGPPTRRPPSRSRRRAPRAERERLQLVQRGGLGPPATPEAADSDVAHDPEQPGSDVGAGLVAKEEGPL